jgi:hypothetical protein
MPSRIILLVASVALLIGAAIVATAGSAGSTDAAGTTAAAQQTCDNTPEIVCLSLWTAGFGRIDATPSGGSTVTCDYTEILLNENPCRVPVPRGSSVTVAATAEPPKQFVHWSRAECPGTEPCTFIPAEDDEWVTAVFTPLDLEVGIEGEGTVEADVPGLEPSPCALAWATQVCKGSFEADQQITLTATPTVGGTQIQWSPGFCEPEGGDYSSSRCTVTMTNIRTFASVGFGVDPAFVPFQISVKVKVERTGSGHGRVTGSGIDCGQSCSQIFGYQSRVTLKAEADAGSKFVRWVGVCSTDETCRFNAGSVTTVRARFDALPPPPPPPPPPSPPSSPPPSPPPPSPRPPSGKACLVPNVVGRRLATARVRIRRARCAVGRIRYARSVRARGRVLAQSPRAGARRPRGTRVRLTVSKGRRR